MEASESWKSDGEERAPAAAGILIDRGQALERLGRYREAREAFRRAGELGSDDEDLLARARIGEAGSTMKLGDPAVAAVMLGETIAGMAPASGKPSPAASETRCRAERVLANALLRQHELEWAETSYRKALELAREVNAPEEIVDAQNGLAALSYFRGEPEQAESTWRAALETAETWDLTQHRAVLLGNIGEMELTRGRLDDAFQTLRRAEALHAYLGSDEGLAEASRLLGECSLALGDRSEAEGHARRALEVADRLGAPQYLGAAHRTMARVLKAAASAGGEDRSAEADVHLEAAAAAFRLAGLEEAARSAELLKGE